MLWETAGKGFVHDGVMVPDDTVKEAYMAQVWVNLASKDRSCPVRVDCLRAKDVPVYESKDGARVRSDSACIGLELTCFQSSHWFSFWPDLQIPHRNSW